MKETQLYKEAVTITQKDNFKKEILYLDMDNVLVDFRSGVDTFREEIQREYEGRLDEIPGVFGKMLPLEDAIETVEKLDEFYDIYLLSTAAWENPSAWSDKVIWVQKYFPKIGFKRLILSHNKHLNAGAYLVDDRLANGADRFTGEHIHFGQPKFPNWETVYQYLMSKIRSQK